MTAAKKVRAPRTIQGAKGGGSSAQHTPVESADSLRSIAYFRILDLVSEGEIGGLVNGQQSIFLDETPLANPAGVSNFPKAHIETRTGTQDQASIPGFDSVENEISVGVELKSVSPWLLSVTDTTLSAVRVTLGVPALSKANVSNGDIAGYSIAYRIDVSTDGGAFVAAYNGTFTGKTTTKYQRSHRIDLPVAAQGWQVKVTRLTANAGSSAIADVTTVDSYTELVDAKLRYPNSAIVAVMGDASQFSNIPQRAYDLFGRIIRVPSNYDVTNRTYAGIWDGTFKPSWTDNPAWVFYDLVTHSRYGLGHLVSSAMIDKWELYRIGQYCDQLVDDGAGGSEPRFACNIYLQSQADAYKLLNDLSSAFRGISYWANGAIVASADMPADPVYTYTDANVIEGKFTYSASARKTRFTTALVSWNDPRNFYRAKVEYVEDAGGIARYGIQQTAVTAVGCTSQGQAQRVGRWILLTSRYETDTVTFSVGLDGTLAAPGQIIRIADSARAGKRQGGRISAANANAKTITVDKAPTVAVGDTLTVTMPDGVSATRTVTGVNGLLLTVGVAFPSVPAVDAVWVVESVTLNAQTYRVLAVTEDKSDTDMSFSITALQHNASKFSAIDNGTVIQVPPISALTVKAQDPPPSVTISEHPVIVQGTAQIAMTISWAVAPNAVTYDAEWRKDAAAWISAGSGIGGLSVDVQGVYTGNYQARVRARNSGNDASVWTYASAGNAVAIIGKTNPPPPPTLHLTPDYLQIDVKWDFPATVNISDTAYTEIVASVDSSLANALTVATPAYPTDHCTVDNLLPAEPRWVWGRLVDKSGNIGPWSDPVSAVGLSVTQFFQPVLDVIVSTNGDAIALRDEIDNRITPAIAELFNVTIPAMAGSFLTLAGSEDYILGQWTETEKRESADELFIHTFSLLGAARGDDQAFVLNSETVQIDATTTLAQKLTAIEAVGIDAKAQVATETTARVTADAAQTVRLDAQQASLALNKASIITETQTRVTSDNALGQRIDSAQAATGTVNARVDSEIQARTTADTANALALQVVKASLGDTPDNFVRKSVFNSDLAKGLWSGGTVIATSLHPSEGYCLRTALEVAEDTGSNRQPVTPGDQYDLSCDIYTADLTGTAAILVLMTCLDKTGAPNYAAQAPTDNTRSGFHTISARVTIPAGAVVGYPVFSVRNPNGSFAYFTKFKIVKVQSATLAVAASVVTETQARVSGDAANAQAVQTLSTNVGTNTAAISTVSQSVNGITGKYAIVLDINKRVSGFQLIGGQTFTSADFVADRFSIADPSDNTSLLTYSNGNLNVTGVVSASLIQSSALMLGSTRISTGGDRLAPFVIKDVAYSNTGNGTQSSRTLVIGNIISPTYGAGYNWKRAASQLVDVYIDVVAGTDTASSSGSETLTVQYRTNGGGWVTIMSVTGRASYGSAIPLVVRFTTPASWSTLDFQAFTSQGNTASLTMSVMVMNFNTSGNAPGSNSGLTGAAGSAPPGDGGGSGGGGGYCVSADAWVVMRSGVVRAGTVVAGDELLLSTGAWGTVSYSSAEQADGVRITTANGTQLTCSSTAPLEQPDGSCVLAPYTVNAVLSTRDGDSTVTNREVLGEITVQHITCEDACFWAGDAPDKMLSHHNRKQDN